MTIDNRDWHIEKLRKEAGYVERAKFRRPLETPASSTDHALEQENIKPQKVSREVLNDSFYGRDQKIKRYKLKKEKEIPWSLYFSFAIFAAALLKLFLVIYMQ